MVIMLRHQLKKGAEEVKQSPVETSPSEENEENDSSTINQEILKTLGGDPTASDKFIQKFHPELKARWEEWVKVGFPGKAKTDISEKYSCVRKIRFEAPKVNQGVPMTEAATKRDKHFVDLQNTVGSAIAAQATAISMMLEAAPGKDVDQESFHELLSHAGQLLLTDIFYQLSVTR